MSVLISPVLIAEVAAEDPKAGPAEVKLMTKEVKLVLASGALVVAVTILAYIVSRIDRWRKRYAGEEDGTEQVTSFRAMYDRGELSKEEYDRILRRVADRRNAKPETRTPADPSTGAPPSEPNPPAPPSPG